MNGQALLVIVTISVVTMALRALPFVAMDVLRGNDYLRYLGRVMPIGVMGLLVAYSLLSVDFTRAPWGLPEIGIMLMSALLYWFTGNSLWSIGSGLVLYVVIASTVLS